MSVEEIWSTQFETIQPSAMQSNYGRVNHALASNRINCHIKETQCSSSIYTFVFRYFVATNAAGLFNNALRVHARNELRPQLFEAFVIVNFSFVCSLAACSIVKLWLESTWAAVGVVVVLNFSLRSSTTRSKHT